MTSEETSKPAHSQAPRLRNTGLHGAFWTRCVLSILRFLPTSFCLIMVRPVALVVYLLAGGQRRPVLANIAALEPDFGPVRIWWGGYRVFLQFALTYLDRLWHMHLKRPVVWDIPNLAQFEAMKAVRGGVLIFTIHSGNYDIGASLFAQKFGRPLHIVRVPEQTEELQKLRQEELRQAERDTPQLHVHYNEVDSHLGMELYRILMASEAVAVQGDRIPTGVSPVQMDYGDLSFKIPRGPLVLAELARVPCFPIFLHRLGCLKYRILVEAPFYAGGSRIKSEELGHLWLSVMSKHVREHWEQWFVFEHLVSPATTRS
jgi:predicted LPLAT superfamily acyltransferase